jgi:hypothetical protein
MSDGDLTKDLALMVTPFEEIVIIVKKSIKIVLDNKN